MDTLDVVIRLQDPARLDGLNHAVFSAALQDYRPLALHVVCQRFDAAALAAVQDNLAPILELAADVAVHLHDHPGPEPAAPRGALLNLGVRHGQGRYLAVLDDGDRIYAEGWRLLIAELAASGAAIAFGAVLNATVCREGVVPYVEAKRRIAQGDGLRRLLRTVCPLHGCVLDRSRLLSADVLADESLAGLADYDLLLRIVAQHPSSFHLQDTVVGEHLLDDDGSTLDPLALAAVERRKAGLVLSPAVQAQLGVNEPGLTVAAYLDRAQPDPGHGG